MHPQNKKLVEAFKTFLINELNVENDLMENYSITQIAKTLIASNYCDSELDKTPGCVNSTFVYSVEKIGTEFEITLVQEIHG